MPYSAQTLNKLFARPEQAKKDTRESAAKRGYGRRWQRLRLMVLARDPVCRMCGRLESTDADHIVAKEQGGLDTLENLQGLCHSCHSIKTDAQDGGFGRGGGVQKSRSWRP
jgi:5-methylcytosine-specific restriction protein A